YSTQTNLVNFAPDQPLLPDTTYEVLVPAGGVRDYAGNPSTTEHLSRFSTGPFLAGGGLRCVVVQTVPAATRSKATISVQLSDPTNVALTVDPGDGSPPKALGPGQTS